MNLERLRAVQAEERQADSLRALPDAFYREVAAFLEGLRAERADRADAAADPFGAEDVRRLTDEIETAEEVAEAIYERRVGKLVKRASLAAAGVPTDEDGLTTEEAELFSDLVAQIRAHRASVLASFESDGPAGERDGLSDAAADGAMDADVTRRDALEPRTDDDPGLDAESAMGGSTDGPATGSRSDEPAAPPPPPDEPPAGESVPGGDARPAGEDREGDSDADGEQSSDGGDRASSDPERVTLRITRDVGEVFGVDEHVYDLAAEDVVTLPAANARPLLDRDAAEPIDRPG